MPDLSIGGALRRLARAEPDALALRCDDELWTRAELDTQSDLIARHWSADGLGVDDVVAVELPTSVDFVLACVAAWKAGATVLPLRSTGEERRAILDLAEPARLVGVADHDDLRRRGARRSAEAESADLWAASWKLSASSGSTGAPKLVRAGASARVDPQGRVAAFVPAQAVQLVAGPIAHAAPFTYAMRGLMTGHSLVLMPQCEATEWLRLIEQHRVTWAPLTPHLMQQIWRVPQRSSYDVSSLESVLHLGARCPQDLKRNWIAWLGADRVVEVYAGSESAGVACIGGREWLEHPGSVGHGVGGTEFAVIGPDGSHCAPGELGEIVMRRPGSTYTYLGADALVRDGWHTLGDAGRLDADGFLYVEDRITDLIRTAAQMVVPADVEAVLDAHPEVASSAVVGRASSAGDDVETVHAVVQTTVTAEVLQAWVADRLTAQLRPTSWRLVDSAVRDAAGKVRRSALKPPSGSRSVGASGAVDDAQ